MTTAILVLLTVLLLVAAAYVGLLLLRRSRAAAPAEIGPEEPQTVGELVRKRTTPADELPAPGLFNPAAPKTGAAAAPASPAAGTAAAGSDAAARTAVVALPQPGGAPMTPPEGMEAGDAPWRRAARMRGDEPGAAWDTAPIPVVPEAAASGPATSGPGAAEQVVAVSGPKHAAVTPAEPVAAESVAVEPVVAEPAAIAPVAEEPAVAEPTAVEPLAAAAGDVVPDAPSHPLSDPDLTPLMGIPIVRAAAADAPSVAAPPVEAPPIEALPVEPLPVDAPAIDALPIEAPAIDAPPVDALPVGAGIEAEPAGDHGLPAPPRRMSAPRDDDEEVVWMTPTTAPIPVVATGSPQPVWFRVVRRDGEPVAAAVVALLDPYGREVDTTKTATDGGGELRAPHGGRFLMIVSAEGFQPRAALLTVEERPVEIALLLPRSAAVAGAVKNAGAPVQGAMVVARQEGEVVDQTGTGPDGTFRFTDLAEGVYALSATDRSGSAVRQVTLSEGADLELDLDLVADAGAR